MVIEHLDEQYSYKIRNYLIHRAHAVRVDADRNQLTLAGLSEDFYADFLNILLNLQLENANTSERNVAGIDLIDWKNQVAAQVSVTCAPNTIRQKIRHSIEKFDKPEGVWQFYFVPIIDEAPKLGNGFCLPDDLCFDQSKDILGIARIMELARGIDKLKKLAALVDLYSNYESGFQDLRKTLDNLLLRTWKAHRSFKLMQTDDIDKRLFPGVQDSHQFEALGRRKDGDTESPVWSIIRDSWREPKNRSIMIEGKGGIGKTVTLFSLTNIKHELIPAPAVYVPMFDLLDTTGNVVNLTDYFLSSDSFASLHPEQRKKICFLAAEEWICEPRLLVLLDGFNEVPGPRRWDVLQMLRKWHRTNPGAQLIAVSRPMDNLSLESAFGDDTISIVLSELKPEITAAYLKSMLSEDIHLPGLGDPIWKIIVYPLFLNLYIKSDRLRNQQAWNGYPLDIRDAAGPGAIIWNYLQRELLRQEDETWILRCALACEYFAPILANHMLQRYEYTISQSDAIEVIEKAAKEISLDRMPAHVTKLFSWWKKQKLSVLPPVFLCDLNWSAIVLRECGLLVPFRDIQTVKKGKQSEQRYEFLHQNFRDCLAGLYLVNQAEMSRAEEFPSLWGICQDFHALSYAAELISSAVIDKLWEANRKLQQRDKGESIRNNTATCNLLELYRQNKKLAKDLDFSGMDIRGLSLINFLGSKGTALPLFRNANHSQGTILDCTILWGKGHFGWITALNVLLDGHVVSSSNDGTLLVWDPTTGQCVQTLEGHHSKVTCCEVLPDGHVVSGSKDYTLRVWDTTTGQCIHALEGHHAPILCVTALPDGRVVSGSHDNTLRIWDISKGGCLQTLRGHCQAVSCVAVLPDGNLVSGSWDSTLRVWDSVTGQCLRVLEGHSFPILCVVALPDGRVISASYDNTLRVWDVASCQCLETLEGHQDVIECIAVLPDGHVVSGSKDYTLRVWDTTTGQCIHTLEGHHGVIKCIAVLPDGHVVSGTGDRTLQVWDPITGQCLRVLDGHNNFIECLVALPDGRVVSGSADCDVRVWDTITGKCLQILKEHRVPVTCVAALQGGCVVSGSEDHTLRVWDTVTGKCLQTLSGHIDKVSCVAVLQDGRVVSGSEDHTLRVWDTITGRCLQTLVGHIGKIRCVAALPNGHVISGSSDSTLRVWDTRTGRCLQVLAARSDDVSCVAVLTDRRIVCGDRWIFTFCDNGLQVWDIETGQYLKKLQGQPGQITCVSVLPDGNLVSGSRYGSLLVWDAVTGRCIRILQENSSPVLCVVALSDGRVVSGSEDGTLRVWDTATGHCLRTAEHWSAVECLAVLPNERVVSGSTDGTVCVWDLDKEKCVDVLEATQVDVSQMNFSHAVLTPALAKMLWRNGAVISSADYESYVHPDI